MDYQIIELKPVEDGVYNACRFGSVPEGWAMIPDDMVLPSTFPRLGSLKAEPITYTYDVEVEVKNEEIGEVEIVKEQRERVIMTVTEMTEGTLPEPVEPEPTESEQMRADVDFLLAMSGVV